MVTQNIETKDSSWFEVQVRYEKNSEDGVKKVTETFVVNAFSFTDAESKTASEMKLSGVNEYEIKAIKKAQYSEVFFSKSDNDDKWCKAVVCFYTEDERTEKLRRSNVTYLVQARDITTAIRYVNEVLHGSVVNYDSIQVTETKIQDCFDYE